MKFFLPVFFFLFFSSQCFSSTLGTDSTFIGTGIQNVNLKTHNYFMLGWRSFGFGPILHFNLYHKYHHELVFGGGVQWGTTNFVIVEAGLLQKKVFLEKGTGFAAIVFIGRNLTKNFRISLPLFYRSIDKGLNKRWQIDFIPYIGLNFKF